MQVKQRLRITSAVSVIALLVVFSMLFLTTYRVDRAYEISKIADDIMTASYERLMLRTDSHRTGNERTKEQLIAKHKQVGALLKEALEKFPEPEDKKTISELLAIHESIGKLSRTIRENREKMGRDARPDAIFQQLEDRLLSQLNMRVYETILLDNKLQKSGNDAFASALKQAGVGSAFVLLFVGAATLLNSWSMGRTIADRVRRLRDGAEVIGGGNLEHHIDIQGDDEFADISDAFNAMTAKLSGSYRALESEIGERKRAEEKLRETAVGLRESEERLRTISDQLPGSAIYQHVQQPDGRIKYAYMSSGIESILGIPARDVMADPDSLLQLIVEDDRPAVAAATAQSALDLAPFDCEFRQRTIAGEVKWVQCRSMPRRMADGSTVWDGVVTDITGRKQAEVALIESEERLRMVLQAGSIGTFEFDLQTGEGQWNNVEFELLGLKPGDAPGKPETFFQYVHPDDIGTLKDKWEDALRIGELDTEFRIVRADGQERWLAGKGRFIKDSGISSQALRFLGVNFDISERKQAEEQIKASLAEKDVMLREIHHRVKNNLQVISSLVSLQADGSRDETVREVLRDVTYRVRSMALVHEKLYQTGDLARIDFAEYAKSLLNYLWRAHGSSTAAIRLTFDMESLSLPVDTAVPCGLILNELAGNALKHAFRGRNEGEVIVTLQGYTDGHVSISLRDNGVGLPEELDWRQTRSMGLRLVQMLAGQLNATLELDRNGGTEFRITFNLPETAKDGEPLHE